MSGTVTIQLDLFQDPHYWDLTPTQRASLPLLVGLMEQFGEDGVLDLNRKAIWRHINLGPKTYGDLLSKMDRWGWGCETEQGRLVLCGPLAPGALLNGSGGDLQKMIAEAVAAALAAALPIALGTAVPAIIKANAAATKAEQRLANKLPIGGETVQDKHAAEGANVQDKEAENTADVQDNSDPSHTRVESIDSIRVDIDSNKSYSSISNRIDIDSIEGEPAATLAPEMCEADVVQMLVMKSADAKGSGAMSQKRAEGLVKDPGIEHCLCALLSLASLPKRPDAPGGYLNSKITGKEKDTPFPSEIVEKAKKLLRPSVPRRPPHPEPPKPDLPEQDRIAARVWSFQQTMTPEEGREIDAEAVDRMIEPYRSDYRTAMADKLRPAAAAHGQFKAKRLEVVQELALRGSDGPNASQGG